MRAKDFEVSVRFCFSSQVTNAKPAYVIVTAACHEDSIEVAQADRTVVLENFAFDLVMDRVVVSDLDVAFVNFRLDPDLVPFSDFGVLDSRMGLPPLFTLSFFRVHAIAPVIVAHAAVFLDHNVLVATLPR